MPRPTKRSKPYIVVFCEGESERAYVDFMKKSSRMLPPSGALSGFLRKLTVNLKRAKNIVIMLK